MHNKRLAISISILILSISILIHVLIYQSQFSNIDDKPKFFSSGSIRMLLTNQNISSDYIIDNELNYDPADQNYCIQNASITNDSKQQLVNFIEGSCSPVIIIPGITATKLQVTIDCDELSSKEPKIFSSCGWSTCSWSLYYSRPSPEYTLWVASVDSPMDFILPNWDHEECFGNLVNLEYNITETQIYLKYTSPPGVNVTWYGNTPLTESISQCGFEGIQNLLPLPIQSRDTIGFYNLQKYYEYMGYQVGLTLFAIPYDFRKTTLANDVSYSLERTIKYAHALTGKKAIIMAHSMGNFGALNILNLMSFEDKQKMIMNYISVAPPFLGATKALEIVIGGDNEFAWHDFGLSFYSQKKFLGSSSAVYDLLPKDAFFRFQGQPWLQQLLNRTYLERTYDVNTKEGEEFWENAEATGNYSFTWFPTPLKTCFEGFINRKNNCYLAVDDWSTTSLLNLHYENVSKSYYANYDNITNILEDFVTFSDYDLNLLNDSYQNNIQLLENPQVPIALIYGSHHLTQYTADYYYDPNPVTSSGSFAWPTNETMTTGDSTVPSTSAITAGIKWAWEFDNKINKTKPVKLLEWCSFYNSKFWLYDTNYTQDLNEFIKNEYIGLNCSCQQGPGESTTGDDCVHASIMNDIYFIKLMANIVKTNNFIENTNKTYVNNLTSSDLNMLIQRCPILTYDRSIQDVETLIFG